MQISEPKVLPPLLSNIVAGLPAPFSGISASVILAKVRGGRGTSPLLKHIAKLTADGLAFYAFLFASSRFVWPIYSQLMLSIGTAKALFLTTNLLALTVLPLGILLTIPTVTPTSQEFKPISKKNIDNMASMMLSMRFLANLLIGAFLPSALIWAYCPATSSLPSLGFGAFVRQLGSFTLCLELSYYSLHRVMHKTKSRNPFIKWLNRIHKVHHSHDHGNMLPVDSLRMHPVEFITTTLCIFLGPVLYRAHPIVAMSFTSFTTANALVSHADFFDQDGGAHVTHHQRSNCNYGLLGFADHFLKTSRSKSIDLLFSLARMNHKMKKKLSRNELDDLIGNVSMGVKALSFGPDETVVNFGDVGKSCFVLLDGTCTASLPNIEDSTNTVVMVYEESGAFFGERALLRGQPRAASIKAGEFGATIAEIPEAKFSLLLNITSVFEEQASSYATLQDDMSGHDFLQDSDFVSTYSSTMMAQEEFAPGQTIIHEGEPGECMYILEEGTCSAFVDGKSVYSYKDSGEYFGELALLNNEPRKASVVAGDSGATVAVVTRALFDKVVAWSGATARQQALEKYS